MADNITNTYRQRHRIRTYDMFDTASAVVSPVEMQPMQVLPFGPRQAKYQRNFLLTCLLDMVCDQIENVPQKKEQLFLGICKKFKELEFGDLLSRNDVFRALRKQFTVYLGLMINNVRMNIEKQNTENLAVVPVPRPIEGHTFLRQTSHYRSSYEELSIIATGGFGVVCKVLSRIDHKEYAIKKILVDHNDVKLSNDIIREVKINAQLSHPNIVSYKTSWLETLQPDDKELLLQSNSEDETTASFSRVTNEEASFSQATGGEEQTSSIKIKISFDEEVRSERTFIRQDSLEFPTHSVLYIQMELCSESLKDWLEARNRENLDPSSIESRWSNVLGIFQQVLKGVAYIHSQGIIHRDLKPANILFSEDHNTIKIVDFGLATMLHKMRKSTSAETLCGNATSPHRCKLYNCDPCLKLSAGVGTGIYAAPEQRSSNNYNNKADMYSLGIILLELVHPFTTDMERHCCVDRLCKEGILPDDDALMDSWPELGDLIKRLINADPHQRPSAQQVLDSGIFDEKEEGSKKLKKVLKKRQSVINNLHRQIKKLKQELAAKDEELQNLKEELKGKDEEIERLKKALKAKGIEL